MSLIENGQSFEEMLESTFPRLQVIESQDIPGQFRDLLLQEKRLIPGLARQHAEPVNIRVIELAHDSASLTRLALLQAQSGSVLGFRALRCDLAFFSGNLYTEIMSCRLPIGELLNKHQVQWNSQVVAYARLSQNHKLAHFFGDTTADLFFGRRSRIFAANQRPIAELFEFLVQPLPSQPGSLCA